MPEPDVTHPGEQEDSYSRSAMAAAMRAAHDRGYSVGWDHGKEHASAPVADEQSVLCCDAVMDFRRSDAAFPAQPLPVFSAGKWTYDGTGQSFDYKDLDEAAFSVYRAALASAPVADDKCLMCSGHGMVGGLTPHSGYDAKPCPDCATVADVKDWRIDTSAGRPILVYKNCSVIEAEDAEYVLRLIAADQASAPVAEEAKVQIEYLDMDNHRLRRALQKLMARLTDLLDEDQFANCESIVTAAGVEPPASTPVAGEAKNYPGDNVAERLDKMADGQPPGSQAQSDLYAAATIWRKHIAHRAAPQASAVAGEAVTWEAVRQELAIFLMGATGRSSKEWHRPLDNASEGGALARMRACLAAPQASAENVRNAALEEAIQAVSGITTSYAVFTSGNPQYRPESRPASAAIAEAIETLRALKRSQADKDGGQQRAGDAFPDYMHDLRYHDQFRIGWNRCVDAYRAALSASQAEQGEREDG